jgi:hypothetical protein
MPPGPSKRQQQAAAARWWAWIADELRAATARFHRRRAPSLRTRLLRRMLAAARAHDAAALAAVGQEYVRRTRVLPPGVYAICPGPGKTVYLPGDRLEPGRRVASLDLGLVHAQVYR